MIENVVIREVDAVNHYFLTIKSKAMKKQMKDPGCCGGQNGCCTGAMVD